MSEPPTFAVMTASAACLVVGCGQIEPPPEVDAHGEPMPAPAPGEEWLQIERITPDDELSSHPTVEIEFNEYLDATSFDSFGTLQLRSGGIVRGGVTDYRMTRKTLLFRPTRQLEPELDYTLVLTNDEIESVVGSPMAPHQSLPTYQTVDELESTSPITRPKVEWDEVEQLFDTYCNDCHADDSWQLPSLTRDNLVGSRSRQTDRILVEPYHPPRSYLMHKLLADYPIRKHTVQPPPWSEHADALSMDDIERIEHWIANGAPR